MGRDTYARDGPTVGSCRIGVCYLTMINIQRLTAWFAASSILLEGQEADPVREKTIIHRGYWEAGLDTFH